MTKKDFANAVNKFFYYANNFKTALVSYHSIDGTDKSQYMPEFFEAFRNGPSAIEWLWKKWQRLYGDYGSRGVMMAFYGELDGKNRALLLGWIHENYEFDEGYGINLKTLEEA